jgi:hypothetical protein
MSTPDGRLLLLEVVVILAGVGGAVRADEAPVPPASEFDLRWSASGLSLSAQNTELQELLAALGQHLGIVVTAGEAMTDRITIEFSDSPLEAALKELLGERSFMLAFGGPWDGPLADSPNRLWIISGAGRTPGVEPNPARHPLAILESSLLHGYDPVEREAALLALADHEDDAATGILAAALRDPAVRVREAAVLALAARSGTVAMTALATALADPAASVREEAVYALAGSESTDALPLLRSAANDENLAVREAAEQLLQEYADFGVF